MKKTEFYCHDCKEFFEYMWEPGAKVKCPYCKRVYRTVEDDGQAFIVTNTDPKIWQVEPLIKGIHPCFYHYSCNMETR